MRNFLTPLITKSFFIVLVVTILSVFTRFYNLNWGAPYFFHPDERNVASSVSQLSYPEQMNPHFFAYGSLPIYTIFFTGSFIEKLQCTLLHTPCQTNSISFEQAIFISRWYSAFFAVLLVPIMFVLGKRIHSTLAGIGASFLAAMSVGFTQFAHFGTFEMWLTFFTTLLFWTSFNLYKKPSRTSFFLSAIILGILIAVKVSSVVLVPLPIIAYFLHKKRHVKSSTLQQLTAHTGKTALLGILVLVIAGIVYVLTNPYVLLADAAFQKSVRTHGISFIIKQPEVLLGSTDFQSSMQYESGVALGTLPVFYTQTFQNTLPVIFHALHVYPFLLNPLVTLLFAISLFYMGYSTFKRKRRDYFILCVFFFILFFSQAFFYVKWIRYMVPTLPFVYLFIGISGAVLWNYVRPHRSLRYGLLSIVVFVCSLYQFSYVYTVLIQPDTRVAAKNWAKLHLPSTLNVLSESYDMGIVPFNEVFSRITLCSLYDYEIHGYICNNESFEQTLTAADLIVLPSQRVLQSRIKAKELFPQGHVFYTSLFEEKNTYNIIYKTPCDLFCTILYLGDPIQSFEQTASVFDRPTVYIIEKRVTQ